MKREEGSVGICKHLQECVKFFSYICQIIQYDYLRNRLIGVNPIQEKTVDSRQ